MINPKRHYSVLLAVLFLLCSSVAGRAADRQLLHGHRPPAEALSAPAERTDSAKRLNLAIGLPLRNQAALTEFLKELSDPSSPNYHKYLTPAQFTERFGPTEADYQAVVHFAKASGLTVTAQHPNRILVDVEGPIATIEKTFHVAMWNYQHPTEGRKFYAPDTEPSVDLAVAIQDISGLDDYSIPHPKLVAKPAGLSTHATPNAGSGPSGAYAAGDFRAAYVPGTTLTGSGQCVGLLQFDGYYASDIAAYETQFGLPGVPLVNVPIDGGVSTPGTGNSEVCLDIEMVMSMAPGISTIYVYEAPNPSPWVDLLSRMANDNLCKQLSCSWGGGSANASAEAIFQQMAAQGQSFFNATGDSDAFTTTIPFPSDSPNITEVGATTLTTTGAGGSYVSETVWNWGGGEGSSGGISTVYSIPSWQQGISMTANHGSTTMRNVPDVALTGDNVYVRYNNGSAGTFGGTSCAAPLWAGFTALVNQQAVSNGRSTVGFLNPVLYSLAKGGGYTSDFQDVTAGNNFSTASPSNFSAVTGYDLCTGLGTPGGTELINLLAGPVDSLQIAQAAPFVASGLIGGPFTSGTATYTLSNNSAAPLAWTAGVTQSWLNLSATSGTLAVSGSATVVASLNAAAASALGSGTYSDTITFFDVTTGTTQTRPATLAVTVPAPVLSVTSTATFSATGAPGGPFTPASMTYTFANTGNAPLSWTAANTQSWLTLSATGGTLASGTSATLTASINSGANSLGVGTHYDTVTFTNASNASGNVARNVILTVALPPAPSITSKLTTTATNGSAYSYQITASSNPTSFGATGLPSGLTVNTSTGLISGTPTVNGSFSATISATNSTGTGSATLAFTIYPPPPVITSALAATGTNGVAFSYQITASNTPTSYSSSHLPTKFSLNKTTGLIIGTPTSTGTTTATISAINSGGTGSASLVITILPSPPAAPAGLAATAGNQQVALSWSASVGATGYNVERSLVSGTNYLTIGSTSATSYIDTGVTDGVTYYYVVSAVGAGGSGANSSQASAEPQAPAITTSEQMASAGLTLSGTASGTMTFNASVVGHTYQLQTTDSLTSGTWTNYGTAQFGTGSSLQFPLPNNPSATQTFYRIQISQ